MTKEEFFQNKDYLRDQQYRDSSNLDARADLHRRYSTSPHDWQQWVFEQLNLISGMAVLECGCGPGWLWRNNLTCIPENCQLTLSDFSDGMVAEAEAALTDNGHDFRFQAVNIETIPFPDDSFDVVVANHMLYHVPNLAAALAEVRRVLKPNGRFYAATNGDDHLREIIDLALKFAPETTELEWPTGSFRLENGRSLLSATFDHIDLILYEDSLEVTDVEPLIAYIRSMTLLDALDVDEETACTELGSTEQGRSAEVAVAKTNEMAAIIAQEIADKGAYHITKNSGLFTAY